MISKVKFFGPTKSNTVTLYDCYYPSPPSHPALQANMASSFLRFLGHTQTYKRARAVGLPWTIDQPVAKTSI